MPDKQSFYQEINEITVFNEEFFKKVYAYSVCDELFIPAVVAKLIGIGRKDVIEDYNKWLAKWKAEDDKVIKKVARWYIKECDREFEKFQKEQQGKAVEKWKESLQNLTSEDLIRML
ncbi:hypothetical protein [Anaerocolumna sp.]|uniref:hypothetical protein n=1 Tax=Anaerocolumna sp. TaxID=2041569 RepID=UPI0028AE2559|nr:hypothetical protein [Anaerocolumna sp.]